MGNVTWDDKSFVEYLVTGKNYDDKVFITFLVETALKSIAVDKHILILHEMNDFDVFDVDPKHPEWGDISTNAAFKYYSQLKFASPKELSEALSERVNEILDFLGRLSVWREPDGTVVFSIEKD